jgi:hypothetical protein
MKKALVVAIAATVAGLVIAPAGSAAGFTIGGDWRMGSFAVKADGTLRGAIDAFGSPGSKERNSEICTVAVDATRPPHHLLQPWRQQSMSP